MRNVIALVVEGSPVWPKFSVESHVAREALRPVQGHEVVVGLDFGRQPAAIFMQAVNNRVLVQYELLGLNEGAVTFAPKVQAVVGGEISRISRCGCTAIRRGRTRARTTTRLPTRFSRRTG